LFPVLFTLNQRNILTATAALLLKKSIRTGLFNKNGLPEPEMRLLELMACYLKPTLCKGADRII
jgi:hypothetical protein